MSYLTRNKLPVSSSTTFPFNPLLCHSSLRLSLTCFEGCTKQNVHLNSFLSFSAFLFISTLTWFEKWRIRINENKSCFMTFTFMKSSTPDVTINDIQIPRKRFQFSLQRPNILNIFVFFFSLSQYCRTASCCQQCGLLPPSQLFISYN
jgi:hypothetical protein